MCLLLPCFFPLGVFKKLRVSISSALKWCEKQLPCKTIVSITLKMHVKYLECTSCQEIVSVHYPNIYFTQVLKRRAFIKLSSYFKDLGNKLLLNLSLIFMVLYNFYFFSASALCFTVQIFQIFNTKRFSFWFFSYCSFPFLDFL